MRNLFISCATPLSYLTHDVGYDVSSLHVLATTLHPQSNLHVRLTFLIRIVIRRLGQGLSTHTHIHTH